MIKRNYENLERHAITFADHIKSKGYDGEFLFYPSDMRANLDHGLRGLSRIWNFSEVKQIPVLVIKTQTHFHTGKNSINVKFVVNYHQEKGFMVSDMEILNLDTNGKTIKSSHLMIKSQDDIPAKIQANASVTMDGWLKKLTKRKFHKI